MYQVEYQIKPSQVVHYFAFNVKSKKEAKDKLLQKYNGQDIIILKVEKI